MKEPKYRKRLNDEQLDILDLLFTFRFISNDSVAGYFGKRNRSYVFRRMKVLLDQELIGRRFDKSYRLQGKAAAYYLTPKGARALQAARYADKEPHYIKPIYKDPTATEQFVEHCTMLFRYYMQLRAQHGDKLQFFTKLQMKPYEYFIRPLPDAYYSIKGTEERYLVDLMHGYQPLYSIKRRVQEYLDYESEGDWEDTGKPFPVVQFICDTEAFKKKVDRKVKAMLEDAWSDEVVITVQSIQRN